MYEIRGRNLTTGDRDTLYTCYTSASVDDWFDRTAPYCTSHYLFSVVNMEFKSENFRLIERPSALTRIVVSAMAHLKDRLAG